MTICEFIEKKAGEGVNLTRAVEELSCTLGVAPRTVWRWCEAQKAPWYIETLLCVLVEAMPEQRARGFSARG